MNHVRHRLGLNEMRKPATIRQIVVNGPAAPRLASNGIETDHCMTGCYHAFDRGTAEKAACPGHKNGTHRHAPSPSAIARAIIARAGGSHNTRAARLRGIAGPKIDHAMTARFPDWSSLLPEERREALATCKRRVASIGRALRAVVRVVDLPPSETGVLGGLPYVAKDMIATGAGPCSWGSQGVFPTGPGPAAIVEQLWAAGARLIASAEMTELAYEPSGLNDARGSVLNPWNFEYVPGGSSSGPASLVAAGCCYAALGSDTGGSVRIPAHCCGVTALKPTWGRLPSEGCMPLAPSLDTIGILARSARDLDLLWTALPGHGAPTTATVNRLVLLEDAFDLSEPEIAQHCREAMQVLSQLGIELVSRGGFPEAADRNALTVMQVEAARVHRDRLEDESIDPILRKRLRKGLSIPEIDFAAALADRERLHDEFVARYLGDAIAVVLPAVPIRTPRMIEVNPARAEFNPRTLYALSALTRFVNFLGLPALALPAGFDTRGMPLAIQLVGRRDSERTLLAIGTALQSRTDWHGRIPAAVADMIVEEKGRA